MTISGAGEDPPTIIDFKIIRDAQLTPEALGPAVLVHIAQHLVPALQRNGADAQAAQYAAMQIVAQLGHREFATLEQTAVQGATGNRMRGEPVSATHIALEPHGEVLVHKTTQWASYVNDTGQTIEFGSEGRPVLKIDFVTGFWLERAQQAGGGATGAPMVFPNADGVKQFALHGKVQRCRLETPDAALKTMLTLRGTTLVDILLYGVARILGWAGIYIEPPGPLDNLLWDRTRPQLDHRFQHVQVVALRPPAHLLNAATYQVQASHSGIRERNAALAFGEHCQSIASRLIFKSNSKVALEAENEKDEKRKEFLEKQADEYRAVLDIIKEKSRKESAPPLKSAEHLESVEPSEPPPRKPLSPETCVNHLGDSLKYSTGNCLEMAMMAAALVQSNAKQFLSERGLAHAEINADIYESKSNGNHAFCVMKLNVNGFTYKIAIDPWTQVSMPYENYLDYMSSYPMSPYTEEDTTYGVAEWVSKPINQKTFITQARNILKIYLAEPGA
ncbi:hypothetical protein MB84_29685 (plasmid) [Pandoraea oxalativorans]|uniref:Uncharacterized protein n=1 Tax=Pandoraea oxalativorans TaxID=573737 RepID=A0A0G3ICN6_9BURK|nr:hypothetical protein MB84_29685 [Pandoraea oxalativorans]